MKQSVNSYDFHRSFEQLRPNNFSYDGLNALFEWFEQYEDDCGSEIELDVIAICCDFAEYTLEELNSEYDLELEDIDEAVNHFNDLTMVIPVNDDIVILQAF